jgi:hypothetical protein
MPRDPDEPVFVRSRWGGNRYVYNWRNPIGRALIVLTLIAVPLILFLLYPD